ncbi:hypothetical protein BV898_10520 [Hypsibius exemplaris]|uniref:Uncharacterized protein n=1 Tax=Hypsibius exemplaris TaxID=2072580 RepID=A0A1W0WJE0_HYPEX|nr:hypothetical protein BV898_10520 [Hypsibius exemplaris]
MVPNDGAALPIQILRLFKGHEVVRGQATEPSLAADPSVGSTPAAVEPFSTVSRSDDHAESDRLPLY